MNVSTPEGFRNITPAELVALAPQPVACRSGARSAKAASSLVALGFTNLMNLDGGMRAYVEAGLPVAR